MKILQITAIYNDDEEGTSVYGLGDDGRVYYWNPETVDWTLWKS